MLPISGKLKEQKQCSLLLFTMECLVCTKVNYNMVLFLLNLGHVFFVSTLIAVSRLSWCDGRKQYPAD